ncbi:hypothetical protein AUP68_10522 [Ilyonectria robusta]
MRTGGPDGLFNKHSAVYHDGFRPAMAWQCLLNQGSILARVAVKVMNTLANSVPSERSFSAISFIHTKARNRLTPMHADMQAFIFMNDRVLDRLKGQKYAHKKRWADLEKDWLELEDSYLELFVNAQGKKVWMDGVMASTNRDFEWEGVLQSTGDILRVGTEVESEGRRDGEDVCLSDLAFPQSHSPLPRIVTWWMDNVRSHMAIPMACDEEPSRQHGCPRMRLEELRRMRWVPDTAWISCAAFSNAEDVAV